MENGQFWGWVGGGIGTLFGILGGVIGTYFTIKNTKGPRERTFTIKWSVVGWIVIVGFVVAILLIPSWYKFLLFIPYAILLAVSIRAWNKAQLQIRKEESGEDA